MGALTNLNAKQIGKLSASRVLALTAADLAGMNAAQLGGIRPAQLKLFSAAQLAGLSGAQLSALTNAALNGLTAAQIATLTPQQIAGFTPAQLASLNPAQVTGFSAAAIAALSPQQLAGLRPKDFSVLGTAQLKAFTAAQVAALTRAELKALSPAQIGSLTGEAVYGLSPAQRAGLNAAQRARLAAPVAPMPYVAPTPAPNPPAPPPSVPTVTPQSPATPAAPSPPPAAKGFTPAELAAMTPTEIAALTAAQINGFSAAQLGALRMDYSSMLSLLEADAGGGITAAEFNALKALVDKFNTPGGIQVSAYLQQIADNVVLGHDANASWTGGASPHALGNMAAGSSALQADELIGKWFLGTDLPEAKVNVTGAPNFTVSHAAVTKELFGANGPGMEDVNQGRLGDCFVMAPLAAMAAMDPASIRAMLTGNGNGTWGVRFFVDGKAQYVTVDNELANGGAIFTSGGNDWAALIEKAYAQLQGGGNTTGTDISFGNSYSSIANGGSPAVTLAEFTGADTITQFIASGGGWTTYVFDGKSLTAENNHGRGTVLSSRDGLATAAVQKDLIADLAAGQELVLSSYADHVDADGKTTLVANHAMTITGFDAATQMFEIYNPWGTAGGGQYWDSSFEASLGSLLADGDVISVAGKSPLLASNPASLVPGAGQPSAGLGLAAACF